MRAFVTGGSGFLGRHLLPYLKERGVAVRALARSESSAALVRKLGAEPVIGDLHDQAAMQAGMSDCDVVIHAAASTAEWGPYAEFYAANVEGTQSVLVAAKAAGVQRIVHVSTEAVLLDGSPLVQVDETRPLPARPLGAYPATKAMAERAALEAQAIVVRPRFIWGRGDTTLLPKLVDMAKTGRFAWIGGGTALTSTCNVDNVCEGIFLAAQKGRPGAIYFLSDGAAVRSRDFLTALLRTQGASPKERSIPFVIALFAARIIEGVWRLFRFKAPPPLQRTSVLLIGQEVTVNDARARVELGYRAHKSREEGLRELST
ncbi:MAG: NAD-dependent epimerase/dehydratase family protein [Myxococcaceae bacterium]